MDLVSLSMKSDHDFVQGMSGSVATTGEISAGHASKLLSGEILSSSIGLAPISSLSPELVSPMNSTGFSYLGTDLPSVIQTPASTIQQASLLDDTWPSKLHGPKAQTSHNSTNLSLPRPDEHLQNLPPVKPEPVDNDPSMPSATVTYVKPEPDNDSPSKSIATATQIKPETADAMEISSKPEPVDNDPSMPSATVTHVKPEPDNDSPSKSIATATQIKPETADAMEISSKSISNAVREKDPVSSTQAPSAVKPGPAAKRPFPYFRSDVSASIKDSSGWNTLLNYHRRLRGPWNEPNTSVTFH
jgi:hypothetical protein